MKYQFGDSDLAGRRLAKVAEVFAPTSRDFLANAGSARSALAIDLGCGPGFTTALIAQTLEPSVTVGLDRSESFLQAARTNPAAARARFLCHDVRETPFPERSADLIFCRFLLTHLAEPAAVVQSWRGELAPKGRLLLEEVEAIHTEQPAFAFYLDTVEAMLAASGTKLYIGPHLSDDLAGSALDNQVVSLRVTNADAARMFSMNVPNWRNNDWVRENIDAARLDQLEAELAQFAEGGGTNSDIDWELRQLALSARRK